MSPTTVRLGYVCAIRRAELPVTVEVLPTGTATAEACKLNSTRFVGQGSCLFHAATSLVAEANASRGVMCPCRSMSHAVL